MPSQLQDLALWKQFLNMVRDSISMNRLTFMLPSHIEHSDASKHRIGSFSATTGIAWWWKMLLKVHWQATLNVLEYLAGYLSIRVDITFGIAPWPGILLPLANRQHVSSWMDPKIKLWRCISITSDNCESDSSSNYGPQLDCIQSMVLQNQKWCHQLLVLWPPFVGCQITKINNKDIKRH